MKKVFSLLLVTALLMGLSVTALAADEPEDVVIEVMEEDYVATPFTGSLTGSDFWLDTRYGHIQLNNNGTFKYKADTDNVALNAAIDSGWSVVDEFILTFPAYNGGWEGRYMKIAIQPEGTKSRGYWTNYTITDLDETIDGTILLKGESTTALELRYGLGRLGLTADGSYSYTHYSFLKAAQAMQEGWIREDRFGVCALGSGNVYDLVVRTTGENDVPTVKNFTYNLSMDALDGVIVGNVLDGAKLGDGFAADHKFKWEHTTGKYGTLTFNKDGSFGYTPFMSSVSTETLTDTFVFSYTDIDGEKATGKLTINLVPVPATP